MDAGRPGQSCGPAWNEIRGRFGISLPSQPAVPDHFAAAIASSRNRPAIFNRLWTLMGTPCVNVPSLNDASGMPLGVQIVGRFGRDREALLAARFLEEAIAVRK